MFHLDKSKATNPRRPAACRAVAASLTVLLIALAACSLRSAEQQKNVLPSGSQSILDHPDKIEILSLQPWNAPGKPSDPAYSYYNCKILGRTAAGADEERIRARVQSLLAGWDGRVAACIFNPRHAIVATKGKDLLEMLKLNRRLLTRSTCTSASEMQGFSTKFSQKRAYH